MVGALLLAAGICASPPLYDMSGPECSSANREIECRCSECFDWPAVPKADWYEIKRVDQDGTVHAIIGTARHWSEWIDEDGEHHPAGTETLWCVAKDASTPNDGRRYVYAVRGCSYTSVPTCGDYGLAQTVYVGAPITCYANGAKIPCPQIP